MDYKVQKYSPLFFSSLSDLLMTAFDIQNKDKHALVKWKLFHEHHMSQSITFVALDQFETVVSHYTNFPVTIALKDQRYRGMLCADMATHPLHRGHGLISKLSQEVYTEVIEKKYDFSLGFSNDAGIQVDKHAENYGYSVVGKFVRYFKVILRKKNIPIKLLRVECFKPDSIFGTQSNFLRLFKDSNYLVWRYISKSYNDYAIYQILNDKNIAGYSARKTNSRIFQIV